VWWLVALVPFAHKLVHRPFDVIEGLATPYDEGTPRSERGDRMPY
jgi:hypothetical protein